jgi:membrane-bound serine protease (ClpP class)
MAKRYIHTLVVLICLAGLFAPWTLESFPALSGTGGSAQAQSTGRVGLVLTADGPLTPAMVEYIQRGLRIAQQEKGALLILQLNTPGGSIDLMTKLVTSIRGSSVPVIVYVSPSGAMAGSAGTVITLAGHASAMAPGTAIGAASPVGSQGEDIGTTEAAKVKEILKATVRSLAAQRGQTAIDLAQATIDSAKAVSADEALKAGLVDFVATDVNDLVRQLNGFTLTTASGKQTLNTQGITLRTLDITLVEQLLQMLTDPNIVFLLLTLGVQAVLIELSNPGGWIAGFIGVVALALATYGLGILPVNWFGMVFLMLSFVLFFLDIKAPTHGALTVVGVTSFIMGALVLFNSPNVPSFERVSVPLVVGTGILTAAAFFTIVTFALRSRNVPQRTGKLPLIGRVGVVRTPLEPVGSVQVAGELWTAFVNEGEEHLPVGAEVEIVSVQGVRLEVRRVRQEAQPPRFH